MSFIQGNINSKEDLIEAMDAMREMLTQGDYKTELELELAEVEHKLAKLNNSELNEDVYTRSGILHALKNHLEDTFHKLEAVEKEPQEAGYDDDEDGDEEDTTDYLGSLAFLEDLLENLNAKTQVEIEKLRKGTQKVGYDELEDEDDDDDDGFYEEAGEEESTQLSDKQEYKKFLELYLEKAYGVPKPQEVEEEEHVGVSVEYLGEILEKINARTQAEVDKLRNNPWGL